MGLTLPETPSGFRDAHAGETIWVLASGASLNHISTSFFADKICVAVNTVGHVLGLSKFYSVTHYHSDALHISEQRPDLPVITPTRDLGEFNDRAHLLTSRPNVYVFPTGDQLFARFDAERDWPTNPDHLVVGPTSLHMTIHFAAYLGAAHIVLIGADCGLLDGASNFHGYQPGDNPYLVWQHTLTGVAERIRATGVSVHSLNPFVNFALEGHTFRGPTVNIN